eukprot:6056466-Prymnesium_polylepis.2
MQFVELVHSIMRSQLLVFCPSVPNTTVQDCATAGLATRDSRSIVSSMASILQAVCKRAGGVTPPYCVWAFHPLWALHFVSVSSTREEVFAEEDGGGVIVASALGCLRKWAGGPD